VNRPRPPLPPERPARWIDQVSELDAVLDALAGVDIFAMDTEFHRERTYYPRLALVQVAWDDEVVLIDPLAVDVSGFAGLFATDAMVVMHAASQDLEVLHLACGTVPRRLFDTQVAAGFVGMSSPSLAALVDHFLGIRLPKGDRLTDWLARPLGDAQRVYAAADVAHLGELFRLEVERLEARGRLAWAQAECELLRRRVRPAVDPELAWLRIKEARHLRGSTRGVARELAAWRERTAQRLDQPVRFIMSDLALVSIAQRSPSSASDLHGIRGIDGRHLREPTLDAVLEAVARGRDLEPDALDHVPEPSPSLERELRPAVTLISAWISQKARDEDLDQSLLATRADVEALLRGDEDARLARGWRQELVGDPIRRLVDGSAAVAYDEGHGLVLQPRATAPEVTGTLPS
jgi:ribonuclease D